jgi:transposase
MGPLEKERRETIVHEHLQNPDLSVRKLAKKINLPKSTVSDVLNRFRQGLSVERKPGSGKNTPVQDKKCDKKVVNYFKKNPSISVRDVAKKVKKSPTYIQQVKKRSGLKSYKAQTVPDRNAKQNAMAKSRSRKLYENILTKFDCVVMDDETYCKADFKQIPGQEFYTSTSRTDVPEEYKTKKRSKFPKKFLVWQAICTCGKKSRTFVTTGTINTDVYINECLQKRLLPLIRSHEDDVLFWPDLASCHYAKSSMEWYTSRNINIVPKEMNPANSPELRPIEEYWSIVKRNLKDTGLVVKTQEEFKRKWLWASTKVNSDLVQRLMSRVRGKVRSLAYSSS